jgi:hypothetical protein
MPNKLQKISSKRINYYLKFRSDGCIKTMDPMNQINLFINIFKILCKQYVPSAQKLYYIRQAIIILNPNFNFNELSIHHKKRRLLTPSDIREIRNIKNSVSESQFLGVGRVAYYAQHTLEMVSEL